MENPSSVKYCKPHREDTKKSCSYKTGELLKLCNVQSPKKTKCNYIYG